MIYQAVYRSELGGLFDQRPAVTADRAVPGHWEGDLIIGAANRSAIGTVVERSSRFTVLLQLPGGLHTAEAVRDALVQALMHLPTQLRRSLAWDQGSEIALHAEIARMLGMPVFFCEKASPWQRPSNENSNGLLRQYFPKGSDLRVHGPATWPRWPPSSTLGRARHSAGPPPRSGSRRSCAPAPTKRSWYCCEDWRMADMAATRPRRRSAGSSPSAFQNRMSSCFSPLIRLRRRGVVDAAWNHPSRPQIQFKPRLADQMLRELAPPLARKASTSTTSTSPT
jgi:hypothetical protein